MVLRARLDSLRVVEWVAVEPQQRRPLQHRATAPARLSWASHPVVSMARQPVLFRSATRLLPLPHHHHLPPSVGTQPTWPLLGCGSCSSLVTSGAPGRAERAGRQVEGEIARPLMDSSGLCLLHCVRMPRNSWGNTKRLQLLRSVRWNRWLSLAGGVKVEEEEEVVVVAKRRLAGPRALPTSLGDRFLPHLSPDQPQSRLPHLST